MGWKMTVLGATLEPDDLTAAEWAQIFVEVNAAGILHLERQISPLHCPLCRNALALRAVLKAGIVASREVAAELVGGLSAAELVEGTALTVPSTASGQEPGSG